MKTQRTASSCPRRLALLLCFLAAAAPSFAAKGVKKGDAQKAIAATPPFALDKGKVSVKEINSTETSAIVRAGLRVAFRFERDAGGAWRVAQVRTGDRQWEEFDLLARAAGPERLAPARAALEAFAAELDALQLAAAEKKAAGKKKDEGDKTTGGTRGAAEQSRGGDKKSAGASGKSGGESMEKAPERPEDELVRGPLSVKRPAEALAALGASAVVEAEIDSTFTLVRERGRWRVTSAAVVGAETWGDFDAALAALQAARAARARADLQTLADALEAHRRERGSYVVADTSAALVDQLNPRFTPHFIRVDPWHRPYEYDGARDAYSLLSLGPDGKPHTPDDVQLNANANGAAPRRAGGKAKR